MIFNYFEDEKKVKRGDYTVNREPGLIFLLLLAALL